MISNSISQRIMVFQGRKAPEEGLLVGYGAIYNYYNLPVPLPFVLCLISTKHKRYSKGGWDVFTPRHEPENNLGGHLFFALKYEALDLHLLKALFKVVGEEEIEYIVRKEPTSQYGRKLWFLYEWLLGEKLSLEDLKSANYVDLVDDRIQYTVSPINSPRQRVRNNLPGVYGFCPLIRKTKKLENYIAKNFTESSERILGSIRKDILMRAAAFLLLKDSKASYAIEGEKPANSRLQKWGKIIGEAGMNKLTEAELIRLQTIVIENQKFLEMGWRKEGGFVGEHDRETGMPIPEHISARHENIEELMKWMLEAYEKCLEYDYDPVLTATMIAFGFVFIHPFVDGNGRIHRYIIHHVLVEKKFVRKGYVFPVSFSMLEKIERYKEVLESFSKPRLDLIEWDATERHNIKVLNETKDLYSYFDATQCAEFLYECIEHTIEEVLPKEVDFLEKYDRFKNEMEIRFEMPDNKISLLVRFLEQGKGSLSKRALEKEFSMFDEKEIQETEELFGEIFN